MEVKSCPFKIGGLGSVSFCNQPLISLLIFLPFSWLLIHHVGSDRKTKWDESSWSWVSRDWWWVPSARSTLWYQQLWGLAVSPSHAFTGLGRAPTTVPVSFRWEKHWIFISTLPTSVYPLEWLIFFHILKQLPRIFRCFKTTSPGKKKVPLFSPNCFKHHFHTMGSIKFWQKIEILSAPKLYPSGHSK